MLGTRKVDPLTPLRLAFVRAEKLTRPGAMRSLAALFDASDPDIAALSEIDAGDALATATRFDREWAYRGGQALAWKRRLIAHGLDDRRRGFLQVDAGDDEVRLHVFATQLAADRSAVRDLRFARAAVRNVSGSVLLFASGTGSSRIGFGDLGLNCVEPAPGLAIWARGVRLELESYSENIDGLGSVAIARATA